MSPRSLSEIELSLDNLEKDIWNCDVADQGCIDGIIQKLNRLQIQVKVQKILRETADLLRKHSSDKILPNQQATRVKHFLRFVFERSTRASERCIRLRNLNCNALIFCGLSYKIRDILDLPQLQFDFLADNVEDFVQRYDLVQCLYRNDIEKAVNNKLDPEDEEKYKDFLKCSSTLLRFMHAQRIDLC